MSTAHLPPQAPQPRPLLLPSPTVSRLPPVLSSTFSAPSPSTAPMGHPISAIVLIFIADCLPCFISIVDHPTLKSPEELALCRPSSSPAADELAPKFTGRFHLPAPAPPEAACTSSSPTTAAPPSATVLRATSSTPSQPPAQPPAGSEVFTGHLRCSAFNIGSSSQRLRDPAIFPPQHRLILPASSPSSVSAPSSLLFRIDVSLPCSDIAEDPVKRESQPEWDSNTRQSKIPCCKRLPVIKANITKRSHKICFSLPKQSNLRPLHIKAPLEPLRGISKIKGKKREERKREEREATWLAG